MDLDGDGIELISVDASGAHFDYGADGFREKTGWLSSDDGFVVFDENGNGIVDGVADLLGNSEVDGFSALALHDQNGDGVIDAADADFARIKIWRDLNGDGISDAGEVSSLGDLGIASISTSHASARCAPRHL